MLAFLLLLGPALAACDNLAKQPKDKTDTPANAAPDEYVWPLSPPAHTLARDNAPTTPPPLSLALLERGRQRFDIYCAPCHAPLGDGRGMVVRRGFPAPPSYYGERLRHAPFKLFYDVITHGYGMMYSYADRVQPSDRWAIAAYIRALQQSQDMPVAELSAAEKAQLPP
jgi:mono/diheme cytochrome c family protein